MTFTIQNPRYNLILAALSLLSVLIVANPPLAEAQTQPSPTSTGLKEGLYSDGNTLVWVGYSAEDTKKTNGDIYGMELKTGREFLIAGGPQNQIRPTVQGNLVVWVEDSTPVALRGKDLSTGREFLVTDKQVAHFDPASIVGNIVYWLAYPAEGLSIMGRDISTMAEPFTVLDKLFIDRNQAFSGFSVIGDHVVWQTVFAGNRDTDCRLYIQKIGTSQYTKLVNTIVPALCYISWAGRGNILAFGDIQSVDATIYNLETNTIIKRFERETLDFDAITFDGRYVIWKDGSYKSNQFKGYDLATGSFFTSPSALGLENYASLSPLVAGNNRLFWLEQKDKSAPTTLRSLPIRDILPTTAQPAPAAPDDLKFYYFTETKHYLKEFKGYWEENGGLATFGFPSSEEFTETDPATGQDYQVQYFERQRLEYHPENAGTPYEILLGLLGSAEAQKRGLTTTTPFAPVKAAPDKTNCTYFAEVGHSLCGKFWEYWRAHGVELVSREGITRSSLALFGFPISEPFTDPDSGFVTQYFERARFEYHPENAGTPYEVLLGRLAITSLTERGWLQE